MSEILERGPQIRLRKYPNPVPAKGLVAAWWAVWLGSLVIGVSILTLGWADYWTRSVPDIACRVLFIAVIVHATRLQRERHQMMALIVRKLEREQADETHDGAYEIDEHGSGRFV